MLTKYESISFWVRLSCLLADIIGSILFLPSKLFYFFTKPYSPQNIKRIVIFRLDGLGDLILSAAALREIRRGFPNAHITLVVSPWASNIIKDSLFFDKLVIYDSFLFRSFRENCSLNIKNELSTISLLRTQNFDLGIDLRGDILSIIPMFLSKCRYRFATATRGGSFLLTHIIPYNHKQMPSQQQKNLKIVQTLGIPINNTKLEITTSPTSKNSINRLLRDNQLIDKKIVALIPCALYKYKSWPPEKFAQLALEILKKTDTAIILIGTEEQRLTLESINQLAEKRLLNLAGKLSITEVAALLEKTSLCVANDSGVMHLAAAFEIPLIQLFGPGPPEPFAHYYSKSSLIQKTDCRYYPCTQRQCKNQANWCMDQITVEDVSKEVDQLIGA